MSEDNEPASPQVSAARRANGELCHFWAFIRSGIACARKKISVPVCNSDAAQAIEVVKAFAGRIQQNHSETVILVHWHWISSF